MGDVPVIHHILGATLVELYPCRKIDASVLYQTRRKRLKARAPNASEKDDLQSPPFDLSNFGRGHNRKIVWRSETGQRRK